MMLADGVIDDTEIQMIQDVYTQLANTTLTADDVMREAEQARSDGLTIHDFLARLAPHLNDAGKEAVVQGAFMVANADGEFHDDEKALLVEIAEAMGMSQAHLKGVIASIEAPAE